MKTKLMPSIVLGSICLVVALLLSVVNMFTGPVIAKNQEEKANAAFTEILPGAASKQEITLDDSYPEVVTAGYKFDNGYVFQMEVAGYKAGLVILCGIDNEGKVTGMKHIQSGETFGLETELNGAYTGDTLDSAELIIAAGATPNSLTSKAYFNAVKAALQSFVIANGGEVDIRTPEQILQDNCNAALGTTEKTFTRWFATEILTDVDNVYKCDEGIVMIISDKFVGIKNDGTFVNTAKEDGTVSAVGSDEKTVAEAAYALYAGTNLTEIEKPDGAKKSVLKIYVTDTGNYVFDMRASGNGINGEAWSHPSGEYIYFSVCISPEGRIVDVITTAQSESKNYGDVCATDEYTEQFKGAVDSDIVITPEHQSSTSTDLGIISGSTITSNGYQQALKNAFAAFNLLTSEEGGNQ